MSNRSNNPYNTNYISVAFFWILRDCVLFWNTVSTQLEYIGYTFLLQLALFYVLDQEDWASRIAWRRSILVRGSRVFVLVVRFLLSFRLE